MEFTAGSIGITLFTGLIAGLASYFGAYSKVKAEVRAATEELKQTIQILAATTRTVELEKAKVAADSALASDQRKAIYSLATATQTLIHSMCWLSWDAKTRNTVRPEMAKAYDLEAHKLLPEVFSQLALLKILDEDLHSRAYPHAIDLAKLDVQFGEAIVTSETDLGAATEQLRELLKRANEVHYDIDILFGGKLRLVASSTTNHSIAR